MTAPARLTYIKTDPALGAMTTYTVVFDDRPVGAVSKVRDRYLRHLGGHRGNNVRAERTAWNTSTSSVNFDTRAEAVIDLLAETTALTRTGAMDLVRGHARTKRPNA